MILDFRFWILDFGLVKPSSNPKSKIQNPKSPLLVEIIPPLERRYCHHTDSSTVSREEIFHEVTKDKTWLALAPVHSPASQYLRIAIPVQVKSSPTT